MQNHWNFWQFVKPSAASLLILVYWTMPKKSQNISWDCPMNPKQTGYCWAHHGSGEVKVDLTFELIARARQGLNWKIPVYEGRSLHDVSPRFRVCRFWELAQIAAGPVVPLQRAREEARPCTRCSLYSTRPGTWNWLESWLALNWTADHRPAKLLPLSEGLSLQ